MRVLNKVNWHGFKERRIAEAPIKTGSVEELVSGLTVEGQKHDARRKVHAKEVRKGGGL